MVAEKREAGVGELFRLLWRELLEREFEWYSFAVVQRRDVVEYSAQDEEAYRELHRGGVYCPHHCWRDACVPDPDRNQQSDESEYSDHRNGSDLHLDDLW